MAEYESLKKMASQMPTLPGVYQMYNKEGKIIYVGKARRLRNRVKSYFKQKQDHRKTQVMMEQVTEIKFIVTHSENEALLLESNLIKQFKPRYNVLFRDDKSYPYLFLSIGQKFPRLDFHRGPKKEPGRYFGPYPNAGVIRDNLALLQKLFKVRQCSDIFFTHRSRPCLQYQIKRCTAPCVGYVEEEQYQQQIKHVLLFLEGKSQAIIDDLILKMQAAAKEREYEQAAIYRDEISTLRQISTQQYVIGDTGHIDIIGISVAKKTAAICVLFIRSGLLLGHRNFFLEVPENISESKILEEFLPQYYLSSNRNAEPLERIVLPLLMPNKIWLQNALQSVLSRQLIITDRLRGEPFHQWQLMASKNAEQGLEIHLSSQNLLVEQFEQLPIRLDLGTEIQRIECFDISHFAGEATVASCVVFDIRGAIRSKYRRYNIRDITSGDDYAALRAALRKHYLGLKKNNQILPDLLIIDGGRGQLKQAVTVLEELQISAVAILGISKGPARKPGLEQLWRPHYSKPLKLTADDPVLHLLQLIRDEAHRFAITGHRKQRNKRRIHSKLEEIPGVGVKRRQNLINYFGGFQKLSQASIVEIAKVPGISKTIAESVYYFCHEKN